MVYGSCVVLRRSSPSQFPHSITPNSSRTLGLLHLSENAKKMREGSKGEDVYLYLCLPILEDGPAKEGGMRMKGKLNNQSRIV